MEFVLQVDEKIIRKIKPSKRTILYFLILMNAKNIYRRPLSDIDCVFFMIKFFLLASPLLAVFVCIFISFFESFVLLVFSILLIPYLFFLLLAYLRYRNESYWITNKRVICKRGLIGYRIISIPLERISDVLVSRNLLERILGFGSVWIESLAGQAGAEAVFHGLRNPQEIQELILEELGSK